MNQYSEAFGEACTRAVMILKLKYYTTVAVTVSVFVFLSATTKLNYFGTVICCS